MSWLNKVLTQSLSLETIKGIPKGIWVACNHCGESLYKKSLLKNLNVCPHCGHHLYIPARKRLEAFLDHDSLTDIAQDTKPKDHLSFTDRQSYPDRINDAERKTKETSALVSVTGKLHGMEVCAVAFEFKFIGGSMGAAVGERFVQAANICLERQCPLICFSASGGARMQEGLFSLLQMAKTSAVLAKMDKAQLPFISVLTHPTTGGVSASLAMLGDIIIAEPKALIGFTGPRVIEQTIKTKLPKGFQRSEFLLEHGAIDRVINRLDMRDFIARMLKSMTAFRQHAQPASHLVSHG